MTQAELWWATGTCAFVAVGAGLAEWQRSRRPDLDKVGVVPWGSLSLLGFLGAVTGLAVALRF